MFAERVQGDVSEQGAAADVEVAQVWAVLRQRHHRVVRQRHAAPQVHHLQVRAPLRQGPYACNGQGGVCSELPGSPLGGEY